MAYYFSGKGGRHSAADEKEDLDPRFQDDDGDDSSWGDNSDSDDDMMFRDESKDSRRARAQAKGAADDDDGAGADESGVRAELKEKKRQVLQLSVLLEALEPVPGLNANKFLDILTQPGREDVDYRDSKIVHLAKKCRNLSVALTHLKNKHAQACKELQDLKARDELELGSSGGRGGAKKPEAAPVPPTEADVARKQQEALVAGLQKQVAELRLKLERSQDEAKKLQRVLVKEVGEEAVQDGSKVMEAGWRGRAQQIVMLRAKVRKLEAQLEAGGGRSRAGGAESDTVSESGTAASEAMTMTSSTTARVDVDRKAEAEVQQIERERGRAAEQAQAEKQELQAELATMRRKLEASKARSAYLEADMGKLKEQMRCLLKKARTDDELIDAQRQELDRLSKGRATVQADRLMAGPQQGRRTMPCPPGGHKSEERKRLEKEMGLDGVDLAVVCAAAGDAERPEDVIRRMRARMKATSSSSMVMTSSSSAGGSGEAAAR